MDKVHLKIKRLGEDDAIKYAVCMPDGKELKTFKESEDAFDWAWEQDFCDDVTMQRREYKCVTCGAVAFIPRMPEEARHDFWVGNGFEANCEVQLTKGK